MNDKEIIDKNYQNLKENFRDPLVNSLDESFKLIIQWLITLNGSGLVAALAFLGTIFNDQFLGFMPFEWSIIFFGTGLLSAFLIVLAQLIYFWVRMEDYKEKVIEADTKDLTAKLFHAHKYLELLHTLASKDIVQQFCTTLVQINVFLSSILFLSGLVSGYIYLVKLMVYF